MLGLDLFPDDAPGSVRPAWQVIEAAKRHRFTGELSLPTEPPVRVYLHSGTVYFAERDADTTLGVRLLADGVVTREQLQRGSLVVNGVEHLGRLFEREPSVDRGAIELCVEMLTDAVLAAVAMQSVDGFTLAVYQRHPSGVDRWLSAANHAPAARPDVIEQARPVAQSPIAPAAERVAELPVAAAQAFVPSPAPMHVPLPAFELDASASGAIADEVADAVRKALAAIDLAAQPAPRFDPDQFVAPQSQASLASYSAPA